MSVGSRALRSHHPRHFETLTSAMSAPSRLRGAACRHTTPVDGHELQRRPRVPCSVFSIPADSDPTRALSLANTRSEPRSTLRGGYRVWVDVVLRGGARTISAFSLPSGAPDRVHRPPRSRGRTHPSRRCRGDADWRSRDALPIRPLAATRSGDAAPRLGATRQPARPPRAEPAQASSPVRPSRA